MTTNPLKHWLFATIPAILGGMTLFVILLNLPTGESMGDYSVPMLVYGFLTTFVLFFGVRLSEGELSPAHVVGMVMFLSLPEKAFPLLIWTACIGALVGGMARLWRLRHTLHGGQFLRKLALITSRVTLAFFTAGQVYLALNGQLPLQGLSLRGNADTLFALVVYILVYTTVYFAIFILENYLDSHPVQQLIKINFSLLVVILFLPVPFALLGADASRRLSTLSEVISLLGIVLIVLGLYAISRSEYQLRKQLSELQTLSAVTRTVRSHLELNALLKTIYLQVAHMLKVDNFTVALLNPRNGRLEFPLVMRRGEEEEGSHELRTRLYKSDLIEHVLKTGTPLLIPRDVQDAAQSMQLRPPPELSYSWVGVPLLAGGNKLGVIAVASERPERVFGQDDLRLLNIVVTSASIAIENAQLYEQQVERLEQMATLNNIAGLLGGTLSPDTVLDTIISSASTIAQANAVAVYLFWDEAKEELPLARSAGLSLDFTRKTPAPLLSKTQASQLHLKMPLVIEDVFEDSRAHHLRALMQQEKKTAIVELPLVIGEKSLGILVLYFDERQSFNGEQLEVFRTFATQASQAIRNARTYTTTDEAFQRSVEQLVALEGIGRQLTASIDLNRICEIVLVKSMGMTNADAGVVALYDERGRHLEAQVHHGYAATAFTHSAIMEHGVSYDTLKTGQVQRLNDVSKSQSYVALREATRSQLTVPILRDRDVLGYVTLESNRLAGFSVEDSHFVSQITNQAVIAIDNARLFSRITEARDRLQVILDTMDEGLIMIDLKGNFALVNPRIALIGLEPQKLLGENISDLLINPKLKLWERMGFNSASDIDRLLQNLKMGGDWRPYTPHLYTTQAEAGPVYIQRYIIPVPDEKGKTMGALLVFYDKTEEQELDRARQELSRMIVHDLRSPLTSVTTSLKLLQDYVPKDSDFYSLVKSSTDASRRAIRKLLGRVDSLLDIAKMESGRLELDTDLIELEAVVENVVAEMQPLAKELDIRLVMQIEDDVPLLNVDADKVERLLLNLVDNALKYSPMENEVIIRAGMQNEVRGRPAFVRVDVVDKGPGVPDNYKETLFNSFVQVEGRQKVRRGVGLGLAFCKLVAEAHGGRIWVEDNPGAGSIFAFTLPIADLSRLPGDFTAEFEIPPALNNAHPASPDSLPNARPNARPNALEEDIKDDTETPA